MASQGSDTNSNEENEPRELQKPEFVSINDLEPEKLGFSINCRVYSVKRKLCREQLNGEIIRIYEAVVYDDSAAITMTLKGQNQISAVKPGDNLTLRNVKVSMHNFHMRLACDRWGLIEKDNESRIKAKMDEQGSEIVPNNVSDQEYERVDETEEENENQGSQSNRQSPHRGPMNYNNRRYNNNRGYNNRRGRGRGNYNYNNNYNGGRGRGRGRRGGGFGFGGNGGGRGGPRRGPYYGNQRDGRRGGRGFRGGRGRGRGGGGRGRGRGPTGGRRFDGRMNDRRSPNKF